MKRKTNLFYTTGPDSKFLTFSNYTEALTGNFLSVNTKLFPDNFLCLNIKGLNSITKPLFIKYLVNYYENKLAVLRDYNIKQNKIIEHDIYPLAYLLEGILKVVTYNTNTNEYELNIENDALVVNSNIQETEIINLITYIGQISESDYFGTYTDIICNINCENYNKGVITLNESSTSEVVSTVSITEDANKLYGWENEFAGESTSSYMFNEYSNETPVYDIVSSFIYNYNSNLSKLYFKKIDENDINDSIIKFNIIIPLFSAVNIDVNSKNYREHIKIDENTKQQYIELTNDNKFCYDTPLGIWINAEKENDTPIILEKDMSLNLFPNWSLLISTQFKPFPYSTKYEKINSTSNNESDSIGNSFATFAETLSKTNDVLNKFSELNDNISKLNSRLNLLEKKINDIGTVSNIQDINEKFQKMESSVKSQIDQFKNQIAGYLNLIKWSGKG